MQYRSLAHDILTNDILDNFSHILAKQNKMCKVVSALFFLLHNMHVWFTYLNVYNVCIV